MKKIYLILITFCLSIAFIHAQESKVENVDLKVKNNKVFVNYDLISNDLDKKNTVELFFVDDRFTIKVPNKLNGDIGEGIEPGVNKTIEWDVFKDNVAIAQKLQPKIIVNGIKKGGAKNAYLSMLVPGLGDYFVKDHREMILKPYLRTVSTLGLITMGVIAKQKRYEEEVWGWVTTPNRNDIPKWSYLGYETRFWLFENDTEFFLAAGIAAWIADIIWVYAKGLENDKLKMFSNYSFNMNTNNGITNFSLSYKF
ncbi:MAG: hypothetical protein R6U15_03785 [Candidatus Izemoplasmatales bacterium]